MKAIFSAYAAEELEDAALYLELEFEGLGISFKQEIRSAVLRIIRYTCLARRTGRDQEVATP